MKMRKRSFLKKAKRFILHYWLSISVGMVLTVKAVELAYKERGYVAYGGEYLVLPVCVMATYMLEQMIPLLILIFSKEGEHDKQRDCRRNGKNYRRIPNQDRYSR